MHLFFDIICSVKTLKWIFVFALFVSLLEYAKSDGITWDQCPPAKIDIREGNPAPIVCKAKTDSEPSGSNNVYRWESRSSAAGHSSFFPLPFFKKYVYNETGPDGTLNIRSVDRTDTGMQFLCLRGRGTKLTRCPEPATLNVFWVNPNVSVVRVSPLPSERLMVGSSVTLECSVTASDTPSHVMWFRNGARLDSSSNILIRDLRITINSLKIEFSGVYHCFVETSTGKMLSRHPLPVYPNDLGRFFTDPVYYAKENEKITIDVTNVTSDITVSWFRLNTFGYEESKEDITYILMTKYEQKAKPNSLSIDSFVSSAPHTRMLIEEQLGGCFFYKVVITSLRDKSPISFIYEIVKAVMSPLDGGKNFEPPVLGSPNIVRMNSTFTQKVYFPFPDHSQRSQNSQQVWVPMPQVVWRFDNGSLIPSQLESPAARIRVVRQMNLEILDAQKKDSGKYWIEIKNSAGFEKASIDVLVTVIPKFPDNLSTLVIGEEDSPTLELKCPYNPDDISPYPASTFGWYLASSYSSWLVVTSMMDNKTGSLHFTPLKYENRGVYRCMVFTNMGDRIQYKAFSGNITLHVKRKLKLCPIHKREVFIELNIQTHLECDVTSEGNVKLKWFKLQDGDFKEISKISGSKYGRDDQKQLIIHYVTKDNGGTYKLRAETNDETVEKEFYVQVGLKPTARITSPDISTEINSPVRINCEINGDPPPKVGWIFKGKSNTSTITLETHGNLDKNGFERMPPQHLDTPILYNNGTLLIRKVSRANAGTYDCTAGNVFYLLKTRKGLLLTVNEYGSPAEEAGKSSMMKTVIIVVSCAVAYLGLIIFLSIYCTVRMQRKRQKRAEVLATFGPSPTFSNGHGHYRTPAGHYESVTDHHTSPEYKSLLGPRHMPTSGPKHLESLELTQPLHGSAFDCHSINSSAFSSIPSSYGHLHTNTPANSVMESTMERICRTYQIDRQKLLYKHGIFGRGLFGIVRLATVNDSPVLVKQLTTDDVCRRAEFTEQIKMFSKCDHDYVTKLVGVCTDGYNTDPPLMILEFCEFSNLADLLAYFKKRLDGESPLNEDTQLKMCLQVAQALEHFHSLGFIHGEIAARNVLVTSEYNLKLSNLGPCLDRFVGHYAVNGSNILMPVRWLPPETIVHNQYSIKTDIWSYAILVNEVFSLAERPYPRLSDSAVLEAASAGSLRPKLVKTVPTAMHAVLEKSWSLAPELRPTAAQLVTTISELTRDMVDV